MDALANWVAQNCADKTLELIHQGPGFSSSNEIKNAKFGDVYGAGLDAEHRDHVHWAMTAAPMGTASNPMVTSPTQERAAKADAHVQEIQERLGELKPNAPQSQRDRLNDQLGFAQQDSARAHADQGMFGASGGKGGSDTQNLAQQFGQGMLSGAMSDLGFGNVLGGKSPLDWGIVKLATGLAGWGLNMANMWADKRGKQLGLPGFAGGAAGGTSGGGGFLGNAFNAGLGQLTSAPGMGSGADFGAGSSSAAGSPGDEKPPINLPSGPAGPSSSGGGFQLPNFLL